MRHRRAVRAGSELALHARAGASCVYDPGFLSRRFVGVVFGRRVVDVCARPPTGERKSLSRRSLYSCVSTAVYFVVFHMKTSFFYFCASHLQNTSAGCTASFCCRHKRAFDVWPDSIVRFGALPAPLAPLARELLTPGALGASPSVMAGGVHRGGGLRRGVGLAVADESIRPGKMSSVRAVPEVQPLLL